MNEITITIINYTILIAGLVISLSGLVFTLAIRQFDKWNRHFFISLFSILVIYLGFELLTTFAMMLRPIHSVVYPRISCI